VFVKSYLHADLIHLKSILAITILKRNLNRIALLFFSKFKSPKLQSKSKVIPKRKNHADSESGVRIYFSFETTKIGKFIDVYKAYSPSYAGFSCIKYRI
jgi:hypothetical protein